MDTNIKYGRPFKFTPNELELQFNNYVVWNKEHNKFFKREMLKSGDRAGEIVDIDTTPPLTIVGFCVFLNINKSTFFDWCANSDNPLNDISIHIREKIELNQLSGACLDLFNPNIVARLNGLNETVDINNTGTAPIINISLPSAIKPLQRAAQDADYTLVNNKSLNS